MDAWSSIVQMDHTYVTNTLLLAFRGFPVCVCVCVRVCVCVCARARMYARGLL